MTRHQGMTCDSCGATISNGLALCETCQGMLVMLLEYVPIYFRNLARWRPSSLASDRRSTKSKRLIDEMVAVLETGRPTSGPGTLSAAASSDYIGNLLHEAHADITGWIRALAVDRPQLAPVVDRILAYDPTDHDQPRAWAKEEWDVRMTCALLTKRIATLTTLPWVSDLMHGVREREWKLRRQTEAHMPGWYAGQCRHCETETFVPPGFHWVTCKGCGAMTAAKDHLGLILDEARGWVAPPRRMAEIIVALVDHEHSVRKVHNRIRQWATEKEIAAIVHTRREYVFDMDTEEIVLREVPFGYPRYRFGEVLDRLNRADTRTDEARVS